LKHTLLGVNSFVPTGVHRSKQLKLTRQFAAFGRTNSLSNTSTVPLRVTLQANTKILCMSVPKLSLSKPKHQDDEWNFAHWKG
jgi:hypothetical protein